MLADLGLGMGGASLDRQDHRSGGHSEQQLASRRRGSFRTASTIFGTVGFHVICLRAIFVHLTSPYEPESLQSPCKNAILDWNSCQHRGTLHCTYSRAHSMLS